MPEDRKRRETGLELYAPGTLKNTPYWYIRGTHAGVAVYKSTRSHTKPPRDYVRSIERQCEDAAQDGGEPGKRKGQTPWTFADACTEYLKDCPDSEVDYIDGLLEYFGVTPLSEIDNAAIQQAARTIYPKHANSTLNRNAINPCSAVLHRAAKLERCAYFPVERLKVKAVRRPWLGPEDAAAIVDALPHRRWLAPPRKKPARGEPKPAGRHCYPRACAVFMYATGCRGGEFEMLDFDRGDVNLVDRTVIFRDTKNGDMVEVPLTDDAFEEIANLPHRDGKVFGYSTKRQFLDDWRAAGDACGIETRKAKGGVTPHSTRASVANWHRRNKASLWDLMELMRWKDEKSARPYMSMGGEELREGMQKLPSLREISVKKTGTKD